MRRTKKQVTFDFTYEDKAYTIRQKYDAQPAKIVLEDGKILYVRVWNLIPLKPEPDKVEPFDPEQQKPADLARSIGGLLAEVVQK